MNAETIFQNLFGAYLHGKTVNALVRIGGDDENLRIRVGLVETITPNHVVINTRKGYRSTRLSDVLEAW